MGSGDPRGRGSKMARGTAAMASLFVLFGAFSAGAWTKDLSRRWRTIQSQHFEVSDPEPLALVARRVLRVAEWAHERLRPLLGHEPRKRVQIVLNDEVDASNGNGVNAGMRLSCSYNGARRHLCDYTPFEGRGLGASVSFARPSNGSQLRLLGLPDPGRTF